MADKHTFPDDDQNDGNLHWDTCTDSFTVYDQTDSQNVMLKAQQSGHVAIPTGNLSLDTDKLDGNHASTFEPTGLEVGDHFVTKVEYIRDSERNLLALCCNNCGETVPCGGVMDHLSPEEAAAARLWMYGHYLNQDCK